MGEWWLWPGRGGWTVPNEGSREQCHGLVAAGAGLHVPLTSGALLAEGASGGHAQEAAGALA